MIGALRLDVLGTELVEETAPLAEEHRNEMDHELVEDAGRECELRGSGAVDQHATGPRTVIRQAIVGEIRNAEGLEAVRGALWKLFEAFILHRGDSKAAPARR